LLEEANIVRTPIVASPSVAIIGAGLGGIAAAVNLTRAGITSFTIFEQSAGPGGTWWDNTYPGAECDIDILFYSYSFQPHDWTRTHASQREIQAYVQTVIDRFELAPHMRYNTRITEAIWDDRQHAYDITTAAGERMRFDILVSAVGLLNVPRYPDWPGLDTFRGPKFHTARWEHQHHLSGKHVAVVGTGSSAAQVVPAIAPVAGRVTMFSREPAYVMPKNERDLTPDERRRFGSGWSRALARAKYFLNIERGMAVRDPKSKRQRDTVARYKSYRDETFAGRPALREWASPAYPFACKRPVLSSDLFPALLRDNVELVPRAVTRVTEHGVVDSDGIEHPADVLVMATGFQPWDFLKNFRLVGRAGRTIAGAWGDEPEAFLGMQVAGFPNFFMMYGPNTNFFCVTFMLERQAEYITRAVRRLIRAKATSIDVRRGVMDYYNRHVTLALSKKTLEADCSNYYHSASGKNVVTWPWWGSVYVLLTHIGGLGCYTRRASTEHAPRHLVPERSHVGG
jgi:cation diffusion facilitator CzcD-associated flavoprotein CzcO